MRGTREEWARIHSGLSKLFLQFTLTIVNGDYVNPTREGDLHQEIDTSIMNFNTFAMSTTDATS